MDEPLVFDQQVRIFWNDDTKRALATLVDPLSGTSFEVDDLAALELCEYACVPRMREELVQHVAAATSRADAEQLVAILIQHGALVAAEKSRWTNWDEYRWGEAATFHFLSRNQPFADEGVRELSAPIRRSTILKYLEESGPPELFKKLSVEYRPLVPSAAVDNVDFFDLLMDRRTVRKYNGMPCDEVVLSSVLRDGTSRANALRLNIERTYKDDPEVLLKSWGSAWEIYVVTHRVDGVAQGIYHYDMRGHGLGLIKAGYFEDDVCSAILGQPMVRGTCFTIFLAARFERYMWRYRYDRGLRNLLINMGELGQTFILAGIARGLGSCMTPALRDSSVDKLLELDPVAEQTMYFVGFGNYGHE